MTVTFCNDLQQRGIPSVRARGERRKRGARVFKPAEMKLKAVISLSAARSKQLLASPLWRTCHYLFHNSVSSLSRRLTPSAHTHLPTPASPPPPFHTMQALDSTNQSTFIDLLLYHSMHPCSVARRMAAALGRDEWTLWGACSGSSCDLNANFGGKGVKALRKLLPPWLALMNSSQRLRQNTRVEDCIHVIKMINYSFKNVSFSFLHLLQPQAREGCAKKKPHDATCLKAEAWGAHW